MQDIRGDNYSPTGFVLGIMQHDDSASPDAAPLDAAEPWWGGQTLEAAFCLAICADDLSPVLAGACRGRVHSVEQDCFR